MKTRRFLILLLAISLLLPLVSCNKAQENESGTSGEISYVITSEPIEDGKKKTLLHDEEEKDNPPLPDEKEFSGLVVEIHEKYITVDPVCKDPEANQYSLIKLFVDYSHDIIPEGMRVGHEIRIKYTGRIKGPSGSELASVSEVKSIEYRHVTPSEPQESAFIATVTREGVDTVGITAIDGEWERNEYDGEYIVRAEGNTFKEGDLVRVVYSGMILESYPPQLSDVRSVTLIDKSELSPFTVFHDGDIEKTLNCVPYSQIWQDGWVFSDGARWRYLLASGTVNIPTIHKKRSVAFYFAEGDRSSTIRIIPSDRALDGSEELPEAIPCDADLLNRLEAGVYYVVVTTVWYGDFIEEEAKYQRDSFETDEEYYNANREAFERTCKESIFRFIVG